MPLTASYYVSPSATPGTGNGTLGNPYTLSDLSIVGGSYKTVASGDVVALLASGTHVLPANLALPAFAGTWQPTVLRGCKADGFWDETNATRALVSGGASNYQVYQQNAGAWLADLDLTTNNTGTGAVYLYNGDGHVLYNCKVTTSQGYSIQIGMFPDGVLLCGCDVVSTGGAGKAVLRIDGPGAVAAYCTAIGGATMTGNGYGAGFLHCVAVGTPAARPNNGISLGQKNNWAVHCTVDGAANAGFLATSGFLLGCLSTNNLGYGYEANTSATRVHLVRCAACGNTAGSTYGSALGITDVALLDPDYVGSGDFTPQTLTLPSLSSLIDAAAGGNLAGALTPAGAAAGGSGAAPGMLRPLCGAYYGAGV